MSDQIIEIARECLGTPFKHQARVVGIGMDCAGVVAHVLTRLELPFNDLQAYPRNPYKGMLKSILDNQPHLTQVNKSHVGAGDVLLMRIRREPQHLGICTGNSLIHSYSDIGRVVEQSLGAWERNIIAVYRIVE